MGAHLKSRERAPTVAWLAFALLAGATLQAQVPSPAEVNLFSNDFPVLDRRVRFTPTNPTNLPAPVHHDQQTLLFQDGRQLRGELAEITKDEVVWKRLDASEPLRFPRGDVRRVLLVPSEKLTSSGGTDSEGVARRGVPAPLPATIKLSGGDWLRGETESADGRTFNFWLSPGAPVRLAREQIEWLHFAPNVAPAYGLGEGSMALEGWLCGAVPRVESKDGTLIFHDARWIGRPLSAPTRFEVAFEVPAESEDGLRLWLQPFAPQPNSYSTGTVQFSFGRENLKWLIYHNGMQSTTLPLPAEARADKGPASYRIFYDGPQQRVILLRNGREIGNLSLKSKVEKAAPETTRRPLRGLCFERNDRGQEGGLQFRRLSVRPWDGALPKGDAPTDADQERLSTPTAPPLVGRLEAVRKSELVFDGKTVPLVADTFVQFSGTPATLANADALLSFGERGEVSLADLRISAGQVRGRSSFAPALEVPATALQSIAFARRALPTPAAGDLLVFKNGDVLSGALVSAATGGSLQWRLASGQEIDFQTGRVAGVRLTNGGEAAPSAAVELRSGERLRGTIAALDERQLRWQHPLLGELTADRAQLWRLYPNPSHSMRDGGEDPERWLRDTSKAKRLFSSSRARSPSNAWLLLDGRFILRASESNTGEQTLGPSCELGSGLDCFELRIDLAAPGGNPGTLKVGIQAPHEGGISINLSSYSMYLYARNPKSPNNGGERELPIRDKIGENVSTLGLRAFVNGPAGTIEFFLNGHYLGRSGQTAAERVPGIGTGVTIDTYSYNRSPLLLSDVTITPWSGELPRFGQDAPVTVLANGDAAAGTPASMTDGRWRLESEIGPLDVPFEKVRAVEFGGAMQPIKAAGRLRLTDGSALLVDHFAWANGQLTAHHATFGDLRLPGSAIRELIYDPAPVRPPMLAEPKKIAHRDEDAQKDDRP